MKISEGENGGAMAPFVQLCAMPLNVKVVEIKISTSQTSCFFTFIQVHLFPFMKLCATKGVAEILYHLYLVY